MVLVTYKFDYKIRLNDGFFSSYTDFDALPGELANRWAVPGDENFTNIPVILDAGISQVSGDINQAYNLYNKSTVRIADGDHVRLKTIRLTYTTTPTFVSKLRLRSLRFSLEANNTFLIYSDDRLNGQDPEFFSTGGVALPPPRTITFSINVGI